MHLPATLVPWSDDEIDWLDKLLMDEEIGLKNPRFPTEIDGFLCALLSGPNLIPPSDALRWIYDCEAGKQQPQFRSDDEALRFMGLVMRQWNYIAGSLIEGCYEPLLKTIQRADGSAFTPLVGWCEGYMDGITLDMDSWLPLIVSEHAGLLEIMVAFGTESGRATLQKSPLTSDEHEEWAVALGDDAGAIHAHWRAYRAPPEPQRRSGPKLGRNDPCHCGSGRKYKHCHGRN